MISNKAKQQILRMRTATMFPFLLEINHPDYGDFRYANVTGTTGVEFEGEWYQPASFIITPPELTQNGYTDAELSLSCIDQEWIIKIRGTTKKASARFVASIVRSENNNVITEAMDDLPFELNEASWNDGVITWKMKFTDPMDISVPVDVANIDNCPGCQ